MLKIVNVELRNQTVLLSTNVQIAVTVSSGDWQQIKNDFNSWNELKTILPNWQKIKDY